MHAGRRGASASPSSDRLDKLQRLRKPEQFAALSGDRAAWRYCLQWICVAARFTGPAPGLRFGFTVAKRQAKRSVMRAMVKRIMKESVRAASEDLAGRAGGRGVDVVMRLRAPLPKADAVTLKLLKRSLRAEADALLQRLGRQLDRAGDAPA